jgi:hypothetical protein
MRAIFKLCTLCALLAGCDRPASPSAGGFAGQWGGRTAQGATIAFTIAADDTVSSITLGHSFHGCSGSETFSNLSISIAPDVRCIPGPCPRAVSSYRAFHFGSGRSVDGPSTAVNALFLSETRAEGTANFRNFGACGDAIGVGWTASRR